MINILLQLVIYIWPFGQLLTFSLPFLPFTIYLLDLAVMVLFAGLVISNKRKEIFTNALTKPLLIFFVTAAISLLINVPRLSQSDILLSVFYLLRLICYPALYFATKFIGFSKLKKPLLISIGFFVFLCLVQYLFFPDMRYLKNLGFDDHYFRLIGSFYDPNFTGAVLASLALLMVFKNKLLYSIPFIVLLGLTFSRASYLVFAIGLIIAFLSRKKIKQLWLIPLLGIIILLIPKPFGEGVNLLRTFSIFSRFDSWKQGLELFLQKPLFGWGYNTLRSIGNTRFQIDNSFIFLLATTGIVGFISFMNLLFRIFNNTKDKGIYFLMLILLLHSFFNNSLFFIWISALFWSALGLGIQKPKEYKSA